MSTMDEETLNPMEPGESKVCLCSLVEGLSGRSARAESGGRGRQELPERPGAGPLLSSASGAQARQWAPPGTPVPAMPPPSARPPALPISWLGSHRAALGDNPSGMRPPAPQSCSFPLAFALSPPACMLCPAQRLTQTSVGTNCRRRGSVPMSFAW